MLSAESFLTSSLRNAPQGQAITRILAASIRAVEPGTAIERFVHCSGSHLQVAGHEYDLSHYRQVNVLGFGKAALAMCSTLAGILGKHLHTGLAIPKHAPALSSLPFTVLVGDHPIPGMRSLEAGQRVSEFVSSLGAEDLLICLVSGGGSALVTTPLEGVLLEDIQALTAELLVSGARIDEMNSLRRRLERFKGGGLVRAANGATIISLILSDVVGNALEAIASGPTAPDPLTQQDALAILEKYELSEKIPASVLRALKESPETPKPGDPIFGKVQNVIVGSNQLAAQAAIAQASQEGFHTYPLPFDLHGDARQAALELASFLRQVKMTRNPVPPPACIVVGGETTVKVTGNGIGGRNTDLALASVTGLSKIPGVMLVSLATDGEDGSTDAAGAVVTGTTCQRAAEMHLQTNAYLDRNDSYTYFSKLDDLLKPGATGTNVNDLVFLFVL
jgi:glycerate 2-kinase